MGEIQPKVHPDTLPTAEEAGQEHIGSLLRDLRKRQEMSQGKLATRLGVSPGAISHYELGRRSIPDDISFVRRLVSTLNPSDTERELLLQALGVEFAGRESDEEFYESMLQRTDRVMKLGAQVVALQAEIDEEIASIRAALHDRYLRIEKL